MASSDKFLAQHRLLILDRYEFESEFEPRQPYSLLSIRRPGSRFARGLHEAKQIARCDIVLHEWDVDAPPWPRPLTELQPRQAVKIVDWLRAAFSTAGNDNHSIVVQSEGCSSQLSAICEFITSCTAMMGTPTVASCRSHDATHELLEMAYDAHMAFQGTPPQTTQADQDAVSPGCLLEILKTIAAYANIDAIVDSRFQVQQVIDLDSATGAVSALTGVADSAAVQDGPAADAECRLFLSGVFRLRKTWILGVNDWKIFDTNELNQHSCVVLLPSAIQEADLSARALLRPWSVHLICEAAADMSLPKSGWLKSGGYVLRSYVGSYSIITVSRCRSIVHELIHRQIRSVCRSR